MSRWLYIVHANLAGAHTLSEHLSSHSKVPREREEMGTGKAATSTDTTSSKVNSPVNSEFMKIQGGCLQIHPEFQRGEGATRTHPSAHSD